MNKVRMFMGVFHAGKRSGDMLSVLILALAACCIFSGGTHERMSTAGQVFVLVIYLTLLVGITKLQMPVFKSNFAQTMYISMVSGVLDSFVLLAQVKKLRTVNKEEKDDEVGRMRLFSIFTIGAIVGGLWLWFGEVYAAGLYASDGRTGVFSALFVLPPVLLFSCILGLLAQMHGTKLVESVHHKFDPRNVAEFVVGVALLLTTHNAMICIGVILFYAWLTNQTSHLFDEVMKNEIEWAVIMVLIIAILKGEWLVQNFFLPLGLATGEYAPIVPSAVQAVLWGPLYEDPSVHFWIRLTNLSVGAGLLPISSLVGVMIFKKVSHWKIYLQYSIPLMTLWWCTMRSWIWLALESPVGHFLERYAK